jgi:hypothetical protein
MLATMQFSISSPHVLSKNVKVKMFMILILNVLCRRETWSFTLGGELCFLVKYCYGVVSYKESHATATIS